MIRASDFCPFVPFHAPIENMPCTNIRKSTSTPAGSQAHRLLFTRKYSNAIPQQAIKNGTATPAIPATKNSSAGIYIDAITGIVRNVIASRNLRNIIM